ncbi:MAG: AraC family transcriptional regulator [Burkholderiales bacterium]|nr:MAG: AraC family transcriptional regulator [Burkholderiales bacterium]
MKWTETDLSGIQSRGVEHSAHSMLGLGALVAEMAEQGISAAALLQGTGLAPEQLADPKALMSTDQKITVFRNVKRLSSLPDVGLRAGCRQRLSDFGVYGYALVSSATFGEAVLSGVRHVKLAGPVLEKRFRVDGDTAIFEGRDVLQLGDILPLSTEFWFSSILKLGHTILEAPLSNRRLRLPYPRPAHASAYERIFNCPVEFDAGVMEWHFDAAALRQPCPNANPITADLCKQFCERMLESLPDEDDLQRRIRTACLNSKGRFPNADEMAERLGLSLRTLQRRLADTGKSYQTLIDEVRASLAMEFLERTSLSVAEIAARTGFSEAASFRKAFRKWTGHPPSHYRAPDPVALAD